jgi:transposase
MAKAKTLVGLDVHATKIVAAVLDAESGELRTFGMNGDAKEAAGFCAGLPRPVRVAYEAGPTGYGLARELIKRRVECVVAAPSKILEREIVALVPSLPWAVQVGRLRCLRGVDTLTAVGLCAEVGDFERFARAEQLMSYVGLVPCESTTGQQRRLGSITKTGSAHARRLLVEASWHYRPRPRIGKALTDRQDGQPPEAIAIAWSAQQRLHRTWTRLEQRAKRRTIIATAAARELAGFCWAITQIE